MEKGVMTFSPREYSLGEVGAILRDMLRPEGGYKKPVLLLGTPGLGKTSVVYQAAEELRRTTGQEWPVLKFRLSEVLPEDFLGIPTVVDGQTHWMPPVTLPHKRNKALPDHGILFFDEINRANRMVLNAVMKVLDRDDLKPGWAIVAAGNLGAEDGTEVEELDTAQLRRFLTLRVAFDLRVWLRWAENAGVDPVIQSFLTAHPEWAVKQFLTPDGRPGWVTPAQWAELSALKGDRPWEAVLPLYGEGLLGPAFRPFALFLTEAARLTADDLLNLAAAQKTTRAAAEKKVRAAARPDLHMALESLVKRLPELGAEATAKAMAALATLGVVDPDAWVAVLTPLGETPEGRKLVKSFLTSSPALAEELGALLVRALTDKK